MCYGGTELRRVTVYIFTESEISADNLFPDANKAKVAQFERKTRADLRVHDFPHEGEMPQTSFVNRTQQYPQVRYETQAPDPIIERNFARQTTEKDRW
jgi:hypothetical protein